MVKINRVLKLPPHVTWRRTASHGGIWAAVALASGCGHYGVDLDGAVQDAAISETTTGKDKPTKPDETTASDGGEQTSRGPDASAGHPSDETKPGKTEDTGLTIGETNTLVSDVSGTHGGTSGGGMSGSGTQGVDSTEPKDAGPDASVSRDAASSDTQDNPGETRGMEAGADSSADDGPTAVTLDGGVPICEPLCSCAQGSDCNLVCGQDECLASCEPGAQCQVAVGVAPVVEITCGAGASCATTEISTLSVDVTCVGEGECHTECDDNQSCSVQCDGPGRCVSKCHGTATCDVDCADGAECYVVYDNLDHVSLNCGARAVKICDGVATCNELCP